MAVTDRDFPPTASLDTLRRRAEILTDLRAHFAARGYWEVETPILSRDVVVDAWLEPFVASDGATGDTWYLQTSPEFAMKRLLAAGADAIFQVSRALRQGEAGGLHNPEFTLVEWYRAGDDHFSQMDFVESLVNALWRGTLGHSPFPQQFQKLTYDEAFAKHAGVNVLSCDVEELPWIAQSRDLSPPASLDFEDRDGWLNFLLSELVEPHLGFDAPTFLYDYPASQAALARVRDDVPPVAERFELYIDGMEICNGYHELTDANELRARNVRQNKLRTDAGLAALPVESRLLDAMESGLPASAGVALGFDRLVMLLLGKSTIQEVIAFPADRA